MEGTYFLALIGLGLALMVMGMKTRIGLLNVLTLPVWIYLAVDNSSSALIMILFIGLSLFNIYLLLWGYRYD